MRLVLDTATFVTAVRSSGGAAGELIRLLFHGRLVALMDLKLGLEYRDVALRPEHIQASGLNAEEILELIEAVEAFSEPVDVVLQLRPLSTDPADDMVLDIAINGRADAVVTNNVRHFLAAGKQLGIPILSPSEALERLRKEIAHAD